MSTSELTRCKPEDKTLSLPLSGALCDANIQNYYTKGYKQAQTLMNLYAALAALR